MPGWLMHWTVNPFFQWTGVHAWLADALDCKSFFSSGQVFMLGWLMHWTVNPFFPVDRCSCLVG